MPDDARHRLARALRSALRGDVEFDRGTRAAYATDSSNYRRVPLGVVFPVDTDDVAAAVRVCAEFDVPVLARGAGTSLAGQACNTAVVVDTSRHLTGVVRIDPEARLATVRPGTVLDDLRAAAAQYGLTFGPDPSTHAWCTLGGMLGNNSCGTHSITEGMTVDNTERLTVVTARGDVLDVGAYDDTEYARAVAAGGPLAPVLGGLREITRRYGDRIRAEYPDIPRRVSGYNLNWLLPERGFHVARSLVGSESTCVIVTEATVRLTRFPDHRRVVVLGYPDVYAAADAVPGVRAREPLGLEGFDHTLVGHMRAAGLHVPDLDLLPPGRGWLLVEVGDDDPDRADQRAAELTDGYSPHWRRYDDPADQRRVWAIRESGLGATARTPDGTHNLEGWEDAAVAPERLGEYLRGIAALWDEYGYTGAWYGHFGDGCVHTRNDFDLSGTDGIAAYRSYVERAADLVVSLGGSLSGEHGDGSARGELLTRMYSPDLIDAFAMTKALWDPDGRMNPGNIIDPYPLDAHLRTVPTGPASRYHALAGDRGSLGAAVGRCVGVGRCRRDDTGVMCPSYRVTRDEKHSTRGRAKLLAEILGGQPTDKAWRDDDVRDALELCLSCKGCAVDCPTGVDMATYKSEFLAHYYAGRRRPRAMYTLGLVPVLARVATRAPGLTNRALSTTWARRLAGVTTDRPAPRFAPVPLRRSPGVTERPDATVVVWPDTFTNAYHPGLGLDTIAVLEAVGETVTVPGAWACCGRPLYDFGMLGLARRWLGRLLDVLDPWIARGVPVVVPEPSCLAAFRDELPSLLADDPRATRLAGLARSLAEHLLTLDLPAGPADPGRVVIHPHCHHRADRASAADATVLSRFGYAAETLDAGCCGLAGSFGFRAEHADLARRIGAERWLPTLRASTGDDRLIVDGFSCRTQLVELDGGTAATLPGLLRSVIDRG